MLEFQELSTGDGDRAKWRALIESLPESSRDIHYTPEYQRVYEKTYGYKILLLVCQIDDNTLIQVVVRRPLSEPVLTEKSAGHYDVESVYGFGGPLALNPLSENAALKYAKAFSEYNLQQGAITEFCVLHPLLQSRQIACLPTTLERSVRKHCVYLDLSEPYHMLWKNIEERQRKAIAVARRKGLRVRKMRPDDHNIGHFQNMYLSTMNRVNANSSWHFPDNYFTNCRDCLGENKVSLFAAELDGKAISYFFLMHEFESCYYHFAAGDPAYNAYNPSSLLMFDTLLWAKAQGLKYYFLGGGRTADESDSLFRFKSSFSEKTAPLISYQRIFNAQLYKDLVATRFAAELDDNSTVLNSDYFPLYRR